MYRRILVPVDGSKTGAKALAHAARLADAFHAEVRALHVLDALVYSNGFERPQIYFEQVLPAMREAGQRILSEARDALQRAGVACDTKLVDCDGRRVAELIVAHAKAWGADLIVMGTHGRRGVDRLLMGSDAEGVARTAPVPVLLVRPDGRGQV